jgi:cobalt ECF transporter T component CbiQ
VKLVLVLVFLISVSLSHNLAVIILIYCLALILGWRSAIPPAVLLKRVWLALPFFTGLIIVPAIFMTPGPALMQLPLGLVVTRTGVMSALFLLLRVSTSLSLTLLLILTTPWNTVLSALSVLRVPDVFVLMLGMTYRYIYLLLRVTNDMFLSRKSRVVGRLSLADNQQLLASIAAALLGKSLELSSAVYLAMQSRGFRGTVVSLKPFKMQPRDWFWSTALGSIAALSIILGR